MKENNTVQSEKWRQKNFVSPSAAHTMTKLLYNFSEDYTTQVSKLHAKYGYGGIVTNVAFNDNYLKDDHQFELVKNGFEYALKEGMKQMWVYDEYQWPSGSAFGQTVEGHPEFESIAMKQFTVSGTGDICYEIPEDYEKIIYAFVKATDGTRYDIDFSVRNITVKKPCDEWTLYVYAYKKTFVDPGPQAHNFSRKRYVNILNAPAIQRFINLTHEKYKKKMGEGFKTVEAFFTDEPGLHTANFIEKEATHQLPWDESLPAVFEKMHGYSVVEHLDSVFYGTTDEDKVIRENFYRTVGTMVADAYFGQIEKWCADNGIKSSGHLLLEERMTMHIAYYGDLMRCLKNMGIPGCDILHVSPIPLMDSMTVVGNYMGCKYASSASRNTGKYDTFMELNPSNPKDEIFLTGPLHQTLGGATLCSFFGINRFNMLNPFESYTEEEATTLNEYIGRLNTVLDKAVMTSGIGIFYPIATMQGLFTANNTYLFDLEKDAEFLEYYYTKLGKALLDAQLDFNLLDEDSICDGIISDGKIQIGNGTYSVILMPCVEIISLNTMKKLQEFEAAGGKIIWIGKVPTFASEYSKSDELKAITERYAKEIIPANMEDYSCVTEEVCKVVSYSYIFDSDAESGLLLSPYEVDGKEILFVANSKDADANFIVSFGDNVTYNVYDPRNGQIIDCNGKTKLTCAAYRGLFIVKDI